MALTHKELKEKLITLIEGDVVDDREVLDRYSHDTSLFEVRPEVVVFPKNTNDVKKIISFVNENKESSPKLSITGRAAGTDMSGGPLNESIILCFTKYFKAEEVNEEGLTATVEPGVFYRDFEKETLPEHITMPTYPASKSMAAFGGMIMNNSGGERTLRYGQTRNFVEEISMVLADGNEYTFSKLNRPELNKKLAQRDFEGQVYNGIYNLLEENYEVAKNAKPHVSKNSAGYDIWDVWDREKGVFDLPQLFVGSQGTLGILTKAKLRLVKEKLHKKMIVLFFKKWDNLPQVVNEILPFDPDSLEAFDDTTLKLGLRFMPEIAKKAGQSLITFALRFLPEVIIGLKMMGMPKLIVLVELAEDSKEEVEKKAIEIMKKLKGFAVVPRIIPTEQEGEKYWIMRRESFNLLRQHVGNKRTAPFIEDFCVAPEKIPEFLPKLLGILKEHGIKANIAGHAGNGNFHIIPLMDLTQESEREKIPVVADLVYKLIIDAGGTITAEHNDGIIRTPYLEEMYGKEVMDIFTKVKDIFDPLRIFNPGKKVDGSKQYMKNHIIKERKHLETK